MVSLEQLNIEKQEFVTLRNNITNVINNISSVINELEKPISNLNLNFIVDDVSLSANKLRNIKTDLEQKKTYLESSVISNIDLKINEYDSQINNQKAVINQVREQITDLKNVLNSFFRK